MTTTDHDALMGAVLDNPDDDLPRLAYADWLEEQGGEVGYARAEFIRVQAELAGRERDGSERAECSWGGTCCCRSHTLRRREEALAGRADAEARRTLPWVGADWMPLRTLERNPGLTNPVYVFRRGFVAEVRAPLAALLEHGPAICRAHPVERMVATDRLPMRQVGEGVVAFVWRIDDGGWEMGVAGEDACLLPPPLFSSVRASSPSPGPLSAAFWDRDTALEALHPATLAHCQDEARKLEAELRRQRRAEA